MKPQHRKKQLSADIPLYNVERVVGKRYDPITNEILYCIKWEGYGEEDNTWEPMKNLKNVIVLIEEFETRIQTTRKKLKEQIDRKKLKDILLKRLTQFLDRMAPKHELREINLSDFDSESEQIKNKQQQQETQPKTIQEPYQAKSHVLTQGFHWCVQNYESNIDY